MSTLIDAINKNGPVYNGHADAEDPVKKIISTCLRVWKAAAAAAAATGIPAPATEIPEVKITMGQFGAFEDPQKKIAKFLMDFYNGGKFGCQDGNASYVYKKIWDELNTIDTSTFLDLIDGKVDEVFLGSIHPYKTYKTPEEKKRGIINILSGLRLLIRQLSHSQSNVIKIGHSTHAIVDDNAFIQLVANGYIPMRLSTSTPRPIKAIRAFLCAKCVYMSYLFNKYRKTLKDTVKHLSSEEAQLNARRITYKNAGLILDEEATPMIKVLISKKAMVERVMDEIETSFKEIVQDGYKSPYVLWKYITRDTTSDEQKAKEIIISFSTEKERYEPAYQSVKFNNLSKNYQELVLNNKLKFASALIENTTYELAYGAKHMVEAGVPPEVRYKFYRMATSFALAPFTMFNSMAMNIALMGPPGTGKSTLAKKIGRFAYAIGWLTANDVILPKPSDLISDVRGETATNTRSFLNSSLGRMIFIDEAYALTPKGDASGKEFADELTEFLTNHKGMLMVMVAGYVKEMNREFFQANIGLPRRFPTKIILGEKSAEACFNAFMWQITNKLQSNNIGALNIEGLSLNQTPFFMDQASLWIPIFHILLGDRYKDNMEPDDKDTNNLLSYYYADIELIAEIYIRYLMSEGLFGKLAVSGANIGNGLGLVDKKNPFEKANIIKHVLNDWLSTKSEGNTFVEDLNIVGQYTNSPVWYIKYQTLKDNVSRDKLYQTAGEFMLEHLRGINDFEPYYQYVSTGKQLAECMQNAKHLLSKNICLWPVYNSTQDIMMLKCPSAQLSISFSSKDPTIGGKPSSATYSWFVKEKDILRALGVDNGNVSASSLEKHHQELLALKRLEQQDKLDRQKIKQKFETQLVHANGLGIRPEFHTDSLKDKLEILEKAIEDEKTRVQLIEQQRNRLEKLQTENDKLKARQRLLELNHKSEQKSIEEQKTVEIENLKKESEVKTDFLKQMTHIFPANHDTSNVPTPVIIPKTKRENHIAEKFAKQWKRKGKRLSRMKSRMHKQKEMINKAIRQSKRSALTNKAIRQSKRSALTDKLLPIFPTVKMSAHSQYEKKLKLRF